ncbi:MAG: DUF6273 domain-containing protein, partial [Bacilli bacterium]|nr:DUF6273 domain-containing protein [Bacilli bacterium]
GEYVYVKNIGNKLTYYYTGRNKDDSSNLLRTLIENESSMIKENITVNGITVNKVIGSKASKSTMKNYVWYSGYLWQVLETNDDGIKMVMAYPITSIAFGESTDYSTSYIRQWLNEGGVFYDKLNRTDLLVDTVMCLDEASDVTTASITLTSNITYTALRSITPLTTCSNTISDKVGTLTLEDYVYSYDGTLNLYSGGVNIATEEYDQKGGVMGYNYISTSDIFWLATPSNITDYLFSTVQFTSDFITNNYRIYSSTAGVRPVITLSDEVVIESGSGISSDPYIVDEGYELESGSNLNTATIGDYVYIDEGNNPYETNQNTKENVRYRIIDIDEKGIKVQRENYLSQLPETIAIKNNSQFPFYTYYDESVSSSLWCYYDIDNLTGYYNGCAGYNYMQSVGVGNYEVYKGNSIGYFLNDADNSFYNWIDTKYQAIIEEVDWNLVSVTQSENPLLLLEIDESNNNGLSDPNNDYDGIYTAKINLPSYGDILSGNDQGSNMWYQNRTKGSSTAILILSSNGSGGNYTASATKYLFAVRPVFYLDLDITIASGVGTKQNPYRLEV